MDSFASDIMLDVCTFLQVSDVSALTKTRRVQTQAQRKTRIQDTDGLRPMRFAQVTNDERQAAGNKRPRDNDSTSSTGSETDSSSESGSES